MYYLLFIIYTCLFCWLIHRMRFFRSFEPGSRLLIILFLYRIAIGIASSYINMHYFEISDIVTFQNMGVKQFNLLLHSPEEYFTNILRDPYHQHYAGVFDISHSYWNNLKSNLIAKILSLFNFFSFRNFYINTLIYNFLIFFGVVALYKAFIQLFPTYRKWIIFLIFIFPTTVYFTSIMHKDGLIFLALGIIMYYISRNLHAGKYRWKIFWPLLMMILIFLLRNYVFMALIPALVAWLISRKTPQYTVAIFSIIYFTGILLFFVTGNIFPSLNFTQIVAERQHAFIQFGGGSAIETVALQPNFLSFARFFPTAVDHAFLRPNLSDFHKLSYLPFIGETMLFICLFLLWIIFPKKTRNRPAFYFFLFFSVSMLLAIGYTITNLGALVRYRSLYLLLLMLLFGSHIQWKRIKSLLHIKI